MNVILTKKSDICNLQYIYHHESLKLCFNFYSVTQTESLFVAKIRNEILSVPFFYCSCIQDAAFTTGQLTEKADCSWEDSLPSCQPLNWGQKKCQLQRKREAVDDIEIDVPEDMIVFEESTSSVSYFNSKKRKLFLQ